MTKPPSPRIEEIVRLVVESDLANFQAADKMRIAERAAENYAREIGTDGDGVRGDMLQHLGCAWVGYLRLQART